MTPERYERLKQVLARRQPDLSVLMERVHKSHNFAAVLRTCDAVGVLRAHIVADADVPPARRVSGGVRRYVKLTRHRDPGAAVRRLKEQGLALVAADPGDGAIDFRDADYTRPTALVLGTELDGLSDTALAAADVKVRIPMVGAVRSLNVSVAAAVILYEAQRQRLAAGLYDQPRLEPATARRTLFEWAYPKIAALCRRRGVEYPELDADGAIIGHVPR